MEEITITIRVKVETASMDGAQKISNTIDFNDGKTSIKYSDTVELDVKIVLPDDGNLNVEVTQEASVKDESVVKDGDSLQFNIRLTNTCDYNRTVSIYDYISTAIKDINILINNQDVTNQYLKENDLIIENYVLEPNSTTTIIVKGTVDLTEYYEATIANSVIVKSNIADVMSNTITYYTSEENKQNSNNQNNNNNNSNNGSSNNGGGQGTNYYTVSGKAWIDNNENGQRDEDEQAVQDISIMAINADNNEPMTESAITGADGSYQIALPEGSYIIAFLYNDEDYYLTTYQASNVDESVNSDAVTKTLNIGGTNTTAGATDEINLSSDQSNIDIGLILRNKFDMKLEKSVDNIVVQNDSGTSTYNFDDSDLAKVEIRSKYMDGSKVTVEYKIKITNVGDIEGNVSSIVDYMPSDFEFDESLNTGWQQSGNYLYNESVSNSSLAPGESTEISLTLTKTMTKSNTGLVNNTAAIQSSYNSRSFADSDSDNNSGSADVIISVNTGGAMRLFLLILGFIIIIAVSIYIIVKRNIYRKI